MVSPLETVLKIIFLEYLAVMLGFVAYQEWHQKCRKNCKGLNQVNMVDGSLL
jgi:hypothetical protein